MKLRARTISLFILFFVLFLTFSIHVQGTSVDNTSITYDSYVVSSGFTTITVTALDLSSLPVPDAVVEIFVYQVSSPSFDGSWPNSGNTQGSTPVQNITQSNGEASFVWQAPDITSSPNPHEIVSFNVTVTSDTDTYSSTFDITVVKTATDLSLSSVQVEYNATYPNIPVLITAVAITPGLGDTTNVPVSITADLGTFNSATAGFTDASSSFKVEWIGPTVTDVTVVHVNATFQEGDTDLFVAQTTLTLYPTNLTASTIASPTTSLTSGESTILTLEAKGPLGFHIPNAQALISLDVGNVNTTTIADMGEDGISYVQYTAPNVTTAVNDTIRVTYSSNGLSYETSLTILVSPKTYDLLITTNSTSVNVGDIVTFKIHVTDNQNPVEGVTVEIATSAGYFLENTATIITLITDSSGNITAHWIANVSSFIGTGSDYVFTITAQDQYSGITQESLSIHVNPPPMNTAIRVSLSSSQISFDDTVLITIQASRYNSAYVNASVYIFAEFGYFTSSGSEQAIGITNTSGYITFEWHTGLTAPLDHDYNTTFMIQVTFFDPPELIEEYSSLIIQGEPVQSSADTNVAENNPIANATPIDQTTSILIAILVSLGVLGVGALAFIKLGR